MASYPTSVKSFSAKAAAQTIDPGHINDLQDEISAIESALVTGPITLTSLTVSGALAPTNLSVSGGSTLAALTAGASTLASLSVTGNSTVAALQAGASTLASVSIAGGSTIATLQAGASTLASLSIAGGSTIATLQAGASTLASLHVSGNSSLAALSAGASTLASLSVSGGSTLAALVVTTSALLPRASGAKVALAAALNVPGSAELVPTWNVEVYDHGAMHSTAVNSSRLVLTSSGVWMIGGTIYWNVPSTTTSTNDYDLTIRLNDASDLNINRTKESDNPLTQSVVVPYLATSTSDYVTLLVGSDNTSTCSLSTASMFWAQKVSD